MKKHTKIYFNYFSYGIQDSIPCEICGSNCADVHHIDPRKMGGSKTKDYIENLIGLCRDCHDFAEAGKTTKENLTIWHLNFMINREPFIKTIEITPWLTRETIFEEFNKLAA